MKEYWPFRRGNTIEEASVRAFRSGRSICLGRLASYHESAACSYLTLMAGAASLGGGAKPSRAALAHPPLSQRVSFCWAFSVADCLAVCSRPAQCCGVGWQFGWQSFGAQPTAYDRATYAKEMREALERWGDHVEESLNDREVTRRAVIKDRPAATLHGNIARLRFEFIGPTRSAPHPPNPAARIKRNLLVEAAAMERPGSVDCPGFFSVAVKTLFCRSADFASGSAATVVLIPSGRL